MEDRPGPERPALRPGVCSAGPRSHTDRVLLVDFTGDDRLAAGADDDLPEDRTLDHAQPLMRINLQHAVLQDVALHPLPELRRLVEPPVLWGAVGEVEGVGVGFADTSDWLCHHTGPMCWSMNRLKDSMT